MATREIKATLALDGAKKFDNELSAASRSLRVMGSEMKAAAADFQAGGDRMDYLRSRSAILKREMQQQENIVNALRGAVEDSARAYGDASAKTDGYRIKLNNAQAALSRMGQELEDTDREMEELGRDSAKVGRQIENGITEAAQDASRSIGDMVQAMKEDIGEIRSNTTISAISDMGGMIVDTVTAANDFAEGTRDRRRELAMLETNAVMAGQDYQTVYNIAMGVAALTGDMNASIEGTSALLKTGFDTGEMSLAIETLGGAVIAFPETMKFENLAESLQESMAAGEATGAFAELMERCGLSTENFKNAMAEAEGEEEKQQVALSFLNAMALRPTYETYMAINGELVNAQGATDKLSDAMARLGGTVDTWLTPIKDTAAEALTGLIDLWDGYEKVFGMARNDFLKESRKKTGGVFAEDNAPIIRTDFSQAMSNIASGLNIGNLFGERAEETVTQWMRDLRSGDFFSKNAEPIIRTDFSQAMSNIASGLNIGNLFGEEAEETVLQWSENFPERIKNAMQSAAEAYKDAIDSIEIDESVPKTEAAHSFFDGLEQTMPLEEAQSSAASIWDAFAGKAKEGGKKAGEDGMNEVGGAIQAGGPLIQEEALISGTDIGNALASGLSAGCANAVSVVSQTVASINAMWSQMAAPAIPSFGGGGFGGFSGGYGSGLGTYAVNMSIDGKTFGRVTAGYTSLAQGAYSSRLARLNA